MKGLMVKVRKLLAMPPRDMWIRLTVEFALRFDFAAVGDRERRLDQRKLLRILAAPDLDALHARLMGRAMPWNSRALSRGLLDEVLPGEEAKVLERAEAAKNGWVCILGSGPVQIGPPDRIQWHRDFKSGLDWPFAHFHQLDPADLDRPSDVKVPWELSRMQWLIPLAQAWQLTGEDRYAEHVKAVFEQWIENNPCAWGINWSCSMEPAMRVFSWCWFYQMLANAPSWQDQGFRFRFLQGIYLHLAFIRRFIEISDVNGNHLTAEAAALVVGGIFLGRGSPLAWKAEGWRLLQREIQLQVYEDGVNFEGSVPYHRLVAELFYVASVAIHANGEEVPESYRTRLLKMADYCEAYLRPDGMAPVIGDNDDARVLPMGGQAIGDHRYLPSLIRYYWAPDRLTESWLPGASECLWWFGELPQVKSANGSLSSRQFDQGGSYLLRSGADYVFFDCGPLGLAGRGGHGHNDMLSFEAVLDGCVLVSDPGCPIYTGDWQLRNKSRSTAVHNTIQIDEIEINRFISPRNLWHMHGDAECKKILWDDTERFTVVGGEHTGYMRLPSAVTVQRRMILDKLEHAVAWMDSLIGLVDGKINATLQLAANVQVEQLYDRYAVLKTGNRHFVLQWHGWAQASVCEEPATVSPQYGITLPATRLRWHLPEVDDADLVTSIYPGKQINPSLFEACSQMLNGCSQAN